MTVNIAYIYSPLCSIATII
uniref:Uncharacterized protein n=1 Tax=Anguilla anguilla TaxID=7936 RepID=A0A0E9Y089_ANGAN